MPVPSSPSTSNGNSSPTLTSRPSGTSSSSSQSSFGSTWKPESRQPTVSKQTPEGPSGPGLPPKMSSGTKSGSVAESTVTGLHSPATQACSSSPSFLQVLSYSSSPTSRAVPSHNHWIGTRSVAMRSLGTVVTTLAKV